MIRTAIVILAATTLMTSAAYGRGLGDLGSAARPGHGHKDPPKASSQDTPYDLGLPDYTGPKKRLAVVELDSKYSTTITSQPTANGGDTTETTINIPPPSDFGPGLTEMLTTALIQSNRFVLLERKALTDIQNEQQLGAGAGFDPTAAAKPGAILGAQALVRGTITEYTFKQTSIGGSSAFAKALHVAHGSATASLAMDIRIYDTSTSQILDSVTAKGSATTSGTAADFSVGDLKMGGSGFDSTPLAHATRLAVIDAVRQICDRMEKLPWEGRIADLDADGDKTTTLYLNAGSASGLKPGDEFEVSHPGRAIIDPESKVVIGRTKDHVEGHCRIDSVTANLSTATPIDGSGFQKDDVVRFVQPVPVVGPPAVPGATAPAVTTQH